VPSQHVREVLSRVKTKINETTHIINIAKGIENHSLMTMSEVINDVLNNQVKIITLSGPSHAEEVVDRNPTAVVSASEDISLAKYVQDLFSTNKFRVYTNNDIKGVEIGGSAKNVIAIAAGFCDGVGYGDNTKSALITRGINEISKLGKKVGAKAETFFGLTGIGDLIVTCDSVHSRNRRLGELVGRGERLSKILSQSHMVAEGVKTAHSIYNLRSKLNIEMPICDSVYRVLYENTNPIKEVDALMTRDLKPEYLD
jgi:glycerol-3-phosphate dehydrogenase (NAD(P)+)